MIVYLWLTVFFVWLFVLGSAVGSFLNVVIYRLPRGKNLLWPSSRCGHCLTPLRLWDNIPLLSYWLLRGRCRYCGVSFSMRYFWVELLTGGTFAALYALEIGQNLHGYQIWEAGGFYYLTAGLFPPHSWPYFVAHVLLASLLICAGACILEQGTFPRGLALTGAVLGVLWSGLYPWPAPMRSENVLYLSQEPSDPNLAGPPGQPGWFRQGLMPAHRSWAHHANSPRLGFVPWPVWGPLPFGWSAGELRLGLLTGLAGILVGTALLRLVHALHAFLGRPALLGSAPSRLILVSGGFLGWQPTIVALALALVLREPLARNVRLSRRAFSLALWGALLICWLGWAWLGAMLRPCLFDPIAVLALLLALALTLTVLGGRWAATSPSGFNLPEADLAARSSPLPPPESRETREQL